MKLDQFKQAKEAYFNAKAFYELYKEAELKASTEAIKEGFFSYKSESGQSARVISPDQDYLMDEQSFGGYVALKSKKLQEMGFDEMEPIFLLKKSEDNLIDAFIDLVPEHILKNPKTSKYNPIIRRKIINIISKINIDTKCISI